MGSLTHAIIELLYLVHSENNLIMTVLLNEEKAKKITDNYDKCFKEIMNKYSK